VASNGFEEIERSDSVDVEVVEWPGCRQIVARLRRGVNDESRTVSRISRSTAARSRMSTSWCEKRAYRVSSRF
jgi:hypothetical protein